MQITLTNQEYLTLKNALVEGMAVADAHGGNAKDEICISCVDSQRMIERGIKLLKDKWGSINPTLLDRHENN